MPLYEAGIAELEKGLELQLTDFGKDESRWWSNLWFCVCLALASWNFVKA